jgi:hypothetical protein
LKARFILILLIFSISANIEAQNKKLRNMPVYDTQTWHWGYFLAVSNYSFNFKTNDSALKDSILQMETQGSPGFNVGLILDLRLSSAWNLRTEPNVSYTARNLTMKYANDINAGSTVDATRDILSTYIDIPLYFKYSGDRRINFRPYAIAGPKISFDMQSNETNTSDNSSRVFRTKTFNIFADFGLGIDWYLPYFRLSTEIKGSAGLLNELVRDGNPPGSVKSPYTDPIESISSRAIFFVVKFE